MYRKFAELGINTIPCKPKTKIAFFSGHDVFSKRAITEEELDEWENKFSPVSDGGPFNFGIYLGFNNLICVDMDTEDPDALKLLPMSPVVRRGRPGRAGAYFYLTDGSVISNRFDDLEIKTGGYIMAPPSIHPDTNEPFTWATPDTLLNIDIKDLPRISEKDLLPLKEWASSSDVGNLSGVELKGLFYTPVDAGRKCPHGSHNRLKKLSAVLIEKCTPIEKAIDELLRYEKEHHIGGAYFSDDTRSECKSKDARENARKFYVNILDFVNKKRRAEGKEEQKPFDFELNFEQIDEASLDPKIQNIEYPHGTMIAYIAKEIEKTNYVSGNPNPALASSLSLMATFLAGKYAGAGGVYPVLYNMILGNISTGKDAAMKAPAKVLIDNECLRKYQLYGSEDFSSEVGAFIDLSWKRFQLNVIDEGSSFLKNLTSTDSHVAGIAQKLTKIWSIGPGYWSLSKAQVRKDDSGEAKGPHFNLLMALQRSMFENSEIKDLLNMGLISRIIYFVGQEQKATQKNRERNFDLSLSNVASYFDHWYNGHPLAGNGKGPREEDRKELSTKAIQPIIIEDEPKAKILRSKIDDLFFERQRDDSRHEFERILYAKATENMARVALITSAARQDADLLKSWKPFEIQSQDLEWAKYLIETSIESAYRLVAQSSAVGLERVTEKIKSISRPGKTLQMSVLLRKLPGDLRQKISGVELCERAGILSISSNGRGKLVNFLGGDSAH